MFINKKREGIDTFICAISLYVAETPRSWIKDQEPPLPIILFGIVAYGFGGQRFSKQLYMDDLRLGKDVSVRFNIIGSLRNDNQETPWTMPNKNWTYV